MVSFCLMVEEALKREGRGLGTYPTISLERALRAWSLPPPVPEVEAAWIIEDGRECSGMKDSEAGGPFPTPRLLELTKRVWM